MALALAAGLGLTAVGVAAAPWAPSIFEFEQPTAALAAGAEPAKAAAAVVDKDSAVELYAGFGKSVYTAFATVGGNAVGVVATGKNLCHNCVAKASRFVRLCDAFSVPVITIVDTEGFVPSVSDDRPLQSFLI